MAAARAPAASLRLVSLTTLFLVVLSHPEQSHSPLSAADAAMGILSYKELTTSLVVNQLAIVQMMHNVSDASCAIAEMERQEARRADEAAEQAARLEALLKPHLQQVVETVETGRELRLQEVLEAINNKISTTAQDTLTRMAEVLEEMDRFHGAGEPEQEATPAEAKPAYFATAVHNDTLPSLCNGPKVLVGSIGSLEVVADGTYPVSTQCSWNITLPVKAPLSLTWEYINMETCGTCGCDWVKVDDLSNGGTSVYGRGLCGSLSSSVLEMLSVVLPPTKNILVSFRTDSSVQGRGFKLNYHVQTKGR